MQFEGAVFKTHSFLERKVVKRKGKASIGSWMVKLKRSKRENFRGHARQEIHKIREHTITPHQPKQTNPLKYLDFAILTEGCVIKLGTL